MSIFRLVTAGNRKKIDLWLEKRCETSKSFIGIPLKIRCLSVPTLLSFPIPPWLLPLSSHLSQGETHHSSCENRGHTKVPRGFSPDTRLLDLRGNHFHYLPSNSFPGLAQVVSLHLQRCKIVEVEGGAFNGLKGLVYLYLSENDLTSLSPDAFKGIYDAKKKIYYMVYIVLLKKHK